MSPMKTGKDDQMEQNPDTPRYRLQAEITLRAIDQYERRLVDSGAMPDPYRMLPRRLQAVAEYLGGAVMAVFIGVAVVLANFVVLNMIIHI